MPQNGRDERKIKMFMLIMIRRHTTVPQVMATNLIHSSMRTHTTETFLNDGNTTANSSINGAKLITV